MSGSELTGAAERLSRQVAHWTPARWAAPVAGQPGRRRGDLVYALVQELADLAAEAEGGPRRAVPRLPNDGVLPDQLRVVVADLAVSGVPADVLADAAARITEVRGTL